MKYQIDTTDSEATVSLGHEIGSRLKGGEIIVLASDLGGGKTTFVKGLAQGAGSDDQVSSPSFTLANEYHAPKFTIDHFDLYRLDQLGVLEQVIQEKKADSGHVVVIEWSNLAEAILEDKPLMRVEFLPTSINERQIIIDVPAALNYLMK